MENNELFSLAIKQTKKNLNIKENSRYKSSAIGNSQNSLIRNILSNLGEEFFTEKDWEETKKYFSNKCAYCGKFEDKLVMDHAVPINRESLGEHRIGNLIPSCNSCNSKKSSKNFKDFLGNDKDKIDTIEKYMSFKNYTPLIDNEQVKMILEIAYNEVSIISNRYINILNEIIKK